MNSQTMMNRRTNAEKSPDKKRRPAAALKQPETNLYFYFQIDDYIKCKTNKVTPGMLRVYKNMKDHLQAFQDHRRATITFNCLDFNFYENLVDFLTFEYVQRRRKP